MSYINFDEKKVIPLDTFSICKEDGKTLEWICREYTRADLGKKIAYKLDKFEFHLKECYGLNIREYYEKYFEEWPVCQFSGEKLGYKFSGKGIEISHISSKAKGIPLKQISKKFEESCKKISKERMGEGNPRYGCDPWNKGLGLEDERIAKIAEQRRGTVTPPEVRKKQSESAKKRTIHGHTGHKHSKENIERFRMITAKRIANGEIGWNRRTEIEIKMKKFLESLGLEFKKGFLEEQVQIKYFCVDFLFPKHKVAIECDGTFFHSDPRFYPNGPTSATQQRNWGRDQRKDAYLKKCGYHVLRYWEFDIENGSYKKELTKELKSLGIIK